MTGKMFERPGAKKKAATFGAVSIITTVLDFGIFNVLVEFEPVPLLVANTLSYGAGILASYLLNKRLTFAGGGREKKHHEIGLFILINLGGLWLNNLAVVYANHLIGNEALVLNGAKLVAGVSTWVLKFVLFEKWVYPQRKAKEEETLP
jgi:putative flippase GtrA